MLNTHLYKLSLARNWSVNQQTVVWLEIVIYQSYIVRNNEYVFISKTRTYPYIFGIAKIAYLVTFGGFHIYEAVLSPPSSVIKRHTVYRKSPRAWELFLCQLMLMRWTLNRIWYASTTYPIKILEPICIII